jgi:hypothetical protein
MPLKREERITIVFSEWVHCLAAAAGETSNALIKITPTV